jgi:hypothetical protein
MEGIDLAEMTQRFGADTAVTLERQAQRHIREGKICHLTQTANAKITIKENCLILTQEGKLLADGIAADLFFEPL